MITDTAYLNRIRVMAPYARFVYYMLERMEIRERRRAGLPQEEWTRDPILRKYKFTNVRRAWDYTSAWLIENWYTDYGRRDGAGLAATFARFFAHVPTFQLVGFPMTTARWLDRAQDLLENEQASGRKVFTQAYMLIGGIREGDTKVDAVINRFIRPVWANGGLLRNKWRGTIDELNFNLSQHEGWGTFLTQEVVLDLMYTFVLVDKPRAEKAKFAVAGPGAVRGLNRIHGRYYDKKVNARQTREEMEVLWQMLARPSTGIPFWQAMTLHDVEFSLCEFDKYERVLHGQGVPKQLFKPRVLQGEATLL
jgi:hypothetical protein